MHEKRLRRKGLKLSVLAGFLALVMVMTAFASHQVPDMTKDGEGIISVDMKTDSGEAVPGGRTAIYRVAEMRQVNGNYYFYVIDPFKGCGVEADIDGKDPDHLTEDVWRELAQRLADYVCDPGNGVICLDKDGAIDETGNVTFSELEFGLYLIVQTEPAPGYYAANPFLVSMPKYEGTEEAGEYIYKVDAFPKTELYPGPTKEVYSDGNIDREQDDDGRDVNVGDVLTYKIDYENNRYGTVTITITDELDERLDFVSASDDGKYNEGTRTITWAIEDVSHGEKGSVTFCATVNDKAMEINEVENTAKVQVGTDNAFVETNTVHNPRREYFLIDEEIVTDIDNIFHTTAWVKDESVNEYYDIEMEMTTLLPVIEGDELLEGDFTMNFHEYLDHELSLDTDTAHFAVYIRSNTTPVNLSDDEYLDENGRPRYYTIEFPDEECEYPGAEPVQCDFHVTVNLSALYEDHIITDEDLQGNTWITIFFHADLEEGSDGEALYGSYSSTVWYEVYDGDSLEYTSNQSVIEVYTYEISIIKYSLVRLKNDDYPSAALSGATLGIYTDVDCTSPIMRNGAPYEVTSGSDGMIVFYGLAGGTYYVKETAAPDGYILSSSILTVDLGALADNVYLYEGTFANRPRGNGGGTSGGGGGSSGGGSGNTGGGSANAGPGVSDGSSEGEPGIWNILPLPQTGQGRALLTAVCAMILAGIGLAAVYMLKRKG